MDTTTIVFGLIAAALVAYAVVKTFGVVRDSDKLIDRIVKDEA